MCRIIDRNSPRRRWVATTPVLVTPPIGTAISPGTVTSKSIMAEAPTMRPSTNAATGLKLSAITSSAYDASWPADAGGRGAGHGSGPPYQAAGLGSQEGRPFANGSTRR